MNAKLLQSGDVVKLWEGYKQGVKLARHCGQRTEGLSETEFFGILEWSIGLRANAGLLELVLAGEFGVLFDAEGDEPVFVAVDSTDILSGGGSGVSPLKRKVV